MTSSNSRRRHRVHTFRDFCAVCWVSPVEPGSACSGERGERADPRWPMDVAYDELRKAERDSLVHNLATLLVDELASRVAHDGNGKQESSP